MATNVPRPFVVTVVAVPLQAAASLRKSATLCRESLRESVTLLRKIERTAAQVKYVLLLCLQPADMYDFEG